MFARLVVAAGLLALSVLAPRAAHAVKPPGGAPPPPCKVAPVDLAVWHDWSLNARVKPCAHNYFGLGLADTKAVELTGLQLAIGLTVVERDGYGVQLAGVGNVAGQDMFGLQISGVGNVAGQDMRGLQLGGLLNIAGEDARVLQIGGLGNVAGETMQGLQIGGLVNVAGQEAYGVQVAGLANASGEAMRGLQVGGLLNAVGEDFVGVQVGGLLNVGGERLRGIQVGGLLNAAGECMSGVQLGGILNVADRLGGPQIAGGFNWVDRGRGLQLALGANRAKRSLDGVQIAIVNVGGDVSGLQLGVVNVAHRVNGVQLGVVNVAEHTDVPLGLVSWMTRGERAVEAWGGEAVPLAAAVRLGTHHVHSLLGVSGDPFHDSSSWGPVGGFGGKAELAGTPLSLGGDLLAHLLFSDGVDDQALLAQARARVLVALGRRVALSAGATWNVFVSEDVDGAALPLGADLVSQHGDTTVRQWPGFTLGVALGW